MYHPRQLDDYVSIVICVQCVERCGNADSNVFVHRILCQRAIDRDGHDTISNFVKTAGSLIIFLLCVRFLLARLHTDATIIRIVSPLM